MLLTMAMKLKWFHWDNLIISSAFTQAYTCVTLVELNYETTKCVFLYVNYYLVTQMSIG